MTLNGTDSETEDIYSEMGARHKVTNAKQIRYHMSSCEIQKFILIHKRFFCFTKNANRCTTRVSHL